LILLTHRGKIAAFHRDCDWSEFFPDAIEDIPTKTPYPFGDPVKLTVVYIDADHTRNNITRRSVTGILLLINNTPLVWISRRQRTVETSTFGSEMIAARMAIDLTGLQLMPHICGTKKGSFF
jgi:hypothetical protein